MTIGLVHMMRVISLGSVEGSSKRHSGRLVTNSEIFIDTERT